MVHLNTDNTMTTPIPLGVHLGVPDADYFADPAISRSDCKAVDAYSLAHWRADQERQAAGERNDSPALIIGSAAHVQLLEPQTWEDRYAVVAAVEKLEAVAIPPIEKEDTPDVPAVEKLELPDPEQRDDKLWYVTCEPGEGYKTKTAAKKAQRPWAWGGVSYSSRKDAADARKAVADRVKPYKWKGQRYAKRADAVADRDAFKDTIKPYAWDKDRFLTRTDAEFARDSYARGRIQLDPGSFVLARDMANATRSHALVGRCFDPDVGHAEVTVGAGVDGVRCRVRLDWLINGANSAQLELDPAVYGDTSAYHATALPRRQTRPQQERCRRQHNLPGLDFLVHDHTPSIEVSAAQTLLARTTRVPLLILRRSLILLCILLGSRYKTTQVYRCYIKKSQM